MSDNSKSALHDIVKSVIDRDGTGPADTMLVNAHLAQMKMFGIRQGVEFFPQQDNLGTQRFDFIQQVIKFNKLDARLDSIWDRFLAYGKGLFYIRPTNKTYRIYWFDKDAYRSYYTPEGGLVLDQFCGRGTVGLACLYHGRRFVGYDLTKKNLDLIRQVSEKHLGANDDNLTLHHSDGITLKEYEGKTEYFDAIVTDPAYVR